MSYVLRQIPINCPNCGEYLYRAFREIFDLTKGETVKHEDEPMCKKCSGRAFIEAIKGAQKIVPLTSQIHSKENPENYGEEIEKASGQVRRARMQKDIQFPDDI